MLFVRCISRRSCYAIRYSPRAWFRASCCSIPTADPTRSCEGSSSRLPAYSSRIHERIICTEYWTARSCGPRPLRRRQPSCSTYRSAPTAGTGTVEPRRSPTGSGIGTSTALQHPVRRPQSAGFQDGCLETPALERVEAAETIAECDDIRGQAVGVVEGAPNPG